MDSTVRKEVGVALMALDAPKGNLDVALNVVYFVLQKHGVKWKDVGTALMQDPQVDLTTTQAPASAKFSVDASEVFETAMRVIEANKVAASKLTTSQESFVNDMLNLAQKHLYGQKMTISYRQQEWLRSIAKKMGVPSSV